MCWLQEMYFSSQNRDYENKLSRGNFNLNTHTHTHTHTLTHIYNTDVLNLVKYYLI